MADHRIDLPPEPVIAKRPLNPATAIPCSMAAFINVAGRMPGLDQNY